MCYQQWQWQWFSTTAAPEQLRKMHWLEKLIKNACNSLLSISQVLELEIHASNEFTFNIRQINSRQLFSPFGYSSVVSITWWHILLLYALCTKTLLECFQNVYRTFQDSNIYRTLCTCQLLWCTSKWPLWCTILGSIISSRFVFHVERFLQSMNEDNLGALSKGLRECQQYKHDLKYCFYSVWIWSNGNHFIQNNISANDAIWIWIWFK